MYLSRVSQLSVPHPNILLKMTRDGEIVRVGRGRYNLASEINGQIGQKERTDAKPIGIVDKSGDSVQSV